MSAANPSTQNPLDDLGRAAQQTTQDVGSSIQRSATKAWRNVAKSIRNANTQVVREDQGDGTFRQETRTRTGKAAQASNAALRAIASKNVYAKAGLTIAKSKAGRWFLIAVGLFIVLTVCILLYVFITVAKNPLQSAWIGVQYGGCTIIDTVTLGLTNQECEAAACRNSANLFLDDSPFSGFRYLRNLADSTCENIT